MSSGAAGRTLTLSGLALVHGALFQRHVPARYQLAVGLTADVSVLALARRWGLDATDLGLARRRARRGARLGLVSAAVIAATVGAASAIPATRGLFTDARADPASVDVAGAVLLRIPLVTALGEELLFRGALLGVADTWLSPLGAATWTSAVFGLWHVTPALASHASNPEAAVLAARVGDGRAVVVAVTVAATTLAGLALAGLRRRSGSLVAPIVAHAAVNSFALLAARRAHRRARPSPGESSAIRR